MMPGDVRCDTCIHWRGDLPALTTAARRPFGADALIGVCMFNPPTVMAIEGVPVSMQAETRADRYCNEWLGNYDGQPPEPPEAEVIHLDTRRPAA